MWLRRLPSAVLPDRTRRETTRWFEYPNLQVTLNLADVCARLNLNVGLVSGRR